MDCLIGLGALCLLALACYPVGRVVTYFDHDGGAPFLVNCWLGLLTLGVTAGCVAFVAMLLYFMCLVGHAIRVSLTGG